MLRLRNLEGLAKLNVILTRSSFRNLMTSSLMKRERNYATWRKRWTTYLRCWQACSHKNPAAILMGRTTVWPAPITRTIPGTPNCARHVERGITSQGLRARRDTVIARTINANAPVKTKSAKPNLFGGGGRLGHVPLRARACWRKCWPCAYAPVDSMHLCRIHWFFFCACLSVEWYHSNRVE